MLDLRRLLSLCVAEGTVPRLLAHCQLCRVLRRTVLGPLVLCHLDHQTMS